MNSLIGLARLERIAERSGYNKQIDKKAIKSIETSLEVLERLKLILKNNFKIEFKEEVNPLGHLNRNMFMNGKPIITDLYTYELLKKELSK